MLLLGKEIQDPGRPAALEREVIRQLREYFAGKRKSFDLPTALALPRFTTEVLEAVARIPYGSTRSYGEIAGAVGNPRGARAVGHNPAGQY